MTAEPIHCFECKNIYVSLPESCKQEDLMTCDGCGYYDEYNDECEHVVIFRCKSTGRMIADSRDPSSYELKNIQDGIDKNMIDSIYLIESVDVIPKKCPYYLEYLCKIQK